MPGVPQPTNFALVRGDAASWTLTVTFPQTAPSSNLNDYTVEMIAKLRYTDADEDAVFQLTKLNGRVTVDGINPAVAHFALSSSDTAAVLCLPPLFSIDLVYDVQIVGADSRPYTVARGTITVVADATLTNS
jgi:hypothetical protein